MGEELKQTLMKELEFSNTVGVEGIRFDPEIFKESFEEDENLKAMHLVFDGSTDDTANVDVPSGLRLPHGIPLGIKKNSRAPYELRKFEDGIYVTDLFGNQLSKTYIPKSPEFCKHQTSDGTLMKTILIPGGGKKYGEGHLTVDYSNECSLGEKGKDCRFCNINATKARFAEKECLKWKTPKQVAESVKKAYEEGYDNITVTGGYIPERREMESYLDIAEHIQEELGVEDFNGTVTIGAPKDISIIERYKEAGYTTMAMNIEIFGEEFFQAICPGKVEVCGDYNHWLEAIDYAVQVFGKGKVRSSIVSGLQPKKLLLEGIEMLAEKGVVTVVSNWNPGIGSQFEGHRTPYPEWHWDNQLKNYAILKRYGRTWKEIYDCSGASCAYLIDRIQDGSYPINLEP